MVDQEYIQIWGIDIVLGPDRELPDSGMQQSSEHILFHGTLGKVSIVWSNAY